MQTKFPEVTKAEWLAKVEKDLRGKPLAELDFEVAGATFSPVHHQDDHTIAYGNSVPGETNNWAIGQTILVGKDLKKANQQALDALSKGANFINFSSALPLEQAQNEVLYDGIILDYISLTHETPKGIDGWQRRHIDLREVKGESILKAIAEALKEATSHLPEKPAFWLTTSDDFFTTIALLRSIRVCWHIILDAKESAQFCTIVATVPSNEAVDENTNKIKATSQAMAAAIAGAEAIFIGPSDGNYDSTFSRRIALNVQHLLQQESHLDRVLDPSAGSYYVENLTNHLAQKIWTEFQQLHREGSNDGGNKSANDGPQSSSGS